MRLLGLLDAKTRRTTAVAAAMLGLSSLMDAGQLAFLNGAALYANSTALLIGAAVAFVVLIVSGSLLRTRGAAHLMAEVELALLERRRRLFDRIRATELRTFEQIEGLADGFNRDIAQVAALAPALIDCLVYAMMLVGLALYLLVLSPLGALAWGATMGLLAWALHRQRPVSQQMMDQVDQAWPHRRRLIEQLTSGFAQLKMDAVAATTLRAEASAAARAFDAAQNQRLAFDYYRLPRAATIIYHIGLAVILFFEPIAHSIEPQSRFKVVTILWLSYRAITFLIDEFGGFITAEQALMRLAALEERLAGATPDREPLAADEPRPGLTSFERIDFKAVAFSYREGDRPTFTVGPIDLSLTRGEVVFITGSNGSGKTTLMKLLTGLYAEDAGQLWLNGVRLADKDRDRYRTLFSAVFMDHHLFGPAYGLDIADPERITALLRKFNLEGVVHWENGRFAPLDLSTGQRQRLAMVVALLEDRPIYVLDEWAAHQDPYLRRYFYETLLPEMRAAGKTVVAISHDARFFHLADRRLHLIDGMLLKAAQQKG